MPDAHGSARFVEIAKTAGLAYRWSIPGKHPFNILQTIGNGCAFLDYNNDGNLDILLVGSHLALYRGDGRGHFTDVTHSAGLDRLSGHFLGCAVGDYDNDGYEDIYISAYGGGILLHNEHGIGFRDVTASSGIKSQPWGTSCAFADVDNDGKLDLYVCNYVQFNSSTPQLCDFGGHLGACPPFNYISERGVLYHNEGNGRFRDITKEWGAQQVTGKALGVAFADYNHSGRQSFYVANDGVPGDLMVNTGHAFQDEGDTSGTAYDANGSPHAGMGLDWGDYDNDGRPDLVVAAFQYEPTCIYHSEGGGQFTERAAPLGIASKTMDYLTFGAKWLDYDNDGWLDLAFANGHVRDNAEVLDHRASYRQSSQLFHNNHGASFTEVSQEAGEGFQRKIVGRGLAVGDFDNDGKLDLLMVDSEGAPLLLHNECLGTGHWLAFQLTGVKSNRDGIGAVVTLQSGGLKQVRRCGTDGSYLSASDHRVHFGLGSATRADVVTIRWPSGMSTVLHHLPADRCINIQEGAN